MAATLLLVVVATFGIWPKEQQNMVQAISDALGEWAAGDAFEGFSAPVKRKANHPKIDRSPLMGRR